MKNTFVGVAAVLAMSLAIISCSGSSSSNTRQVSGFKFRAFVSNPLFPNGTLNSPVINVVNAQNDILAGSVISLLGSSAQPQMMFESPSLKYTVVFSPVGNNLVVIDNTTEVIATIGTTNAAVPTITLPGFTESLVIAGDNATAYAAVPNAPITGGAPGAVVVMNITTGAVTATIPVPGAHYLALSPDGNNLLVFSDGSDSITVIATILIGSNQAGLTTVVPGFDRPVSAIFNGSTAYVFNCGAECGGGKSSVVQYSVATGIGTSVAVPGATYGLLTGNGSILYVAGTPPGTACPSGTAATKCGTLTTVDPASMTVSGSPALITDGYHNRMQISDNGQLFMGARSCTNVNTSSEVRGCLSILNTSTGAVVIPPALGDATGIQPISGRNVVYVCQGGTFELFDTTTDKFLVQIQGTVIVGQSFDVKLVDLP